MIPLSGRLAAALALALLLAGAVPALAHAPASRPASPRTLAVGTEGPSAAGAARPLAIPGALVGLAAALALALATRRPRRAVAGLALVALVAFAFEGGLHSVHHLDDDLGASQCAAASASTQLAGTTDEPVPALAPAPPAVEGCPGVAVLASASSPFRPDAGRAPPHLRPA
jgi:hypothetical protein